MNKITDDAVLVETAVLISGTEATEATEVTEATANADVTDILYPNILGSYIEQSDKTEGWFSRITRLSYEAWLARGGVESSVE